MSTETLPGQQVSNGQTRPPPPEREMTLLEHLEELRRRLVYIGVALIGGLVVAALPIPGSAHEYPFNTVAGTVVRLVVAPAAGTIQAIRPGETLFTFFHVMLLTAAALAMPLIIYQILAFIMPGLYPNERRGFLVAVPAVVFAFAAGLAFGYLALLPFAVTFLLTFGAQEITPQWSFSAYVGTVTMLLFGMGAAFQLPLIMFTLAKLGVVQADRMKRFRKYAFLLAFVIGAVITPTPDPFNQTLVALPVYMLFEIGILLARLARPRQTPESSA